MRVLLTGFEPFPGVTVNPSGEAVARIAASRGMEPRLAAWVLPVLWDRTWTTFEDRLAASGFEPDVIIHVGVSRTADAVTYERFALNWRKGMDAGDVTTTEGPILDGAPHARMATLDLSRVLGALETTDRPAVTSCHAGTYLCNALLYRSLHAQAIGARVADVGFLHVPPLPAEGDPAPALDRLTTELTAIVDAFLAAPSVGT